MELDLQLFVSGITGIITSGVGLGVKLLNDKLSKLNGSVATNAESIHCHDVTLARMQECHQQISNNLNKTIVQIELLDKKFNQQVLNQAAYAARLDKEEK